MIRLFTILRACVGASMFLNVNLVISNMDGESGAMVVWMSGSDPDGGAYIDGVAICGASCSQTA